MAIYSLNREVNLDKGELLLSLPFADTYDLEQLEHRKRSSGRPVPRKRRRYLLHKEKLSRRYSD